MVRGAGQGSWCFPRAGRSHRGESGGGPGCPPGGQGGFGACNRPSGSELTLQRRGAKWRRGARYRPPERSAGLVWVLPPSQPRRSARGHGRRAEGPRPCGLLQVEAWGRRDPVPPGAAPGAPRDGLFGPRPPRLWPAHGQCRALLGNLNTG